MHHARTEGVGGQLDAEDKFALSCSEEGEGERREILLQSQIWVRFCHKFLAFVCS